MAIDIKLPKLGESAEGGTVVSLLVKEGDAITQGQTVLEVENEKAVAPIPATASGTVAQLRVKVGDRVGVGQVILTVAESGSGTARTAKTPPPKVATVAPSAGPAQPNPTPLAEPNEALADEPSSDGPAPAAAPSIRRLARELGVDLAKIRGSERGGRIVLADIRAYIQRLQALAAQAKATPAASAPATTSAPTGAPPLERIDFTQWGPVTRQPLTILRATISRRMSESWRAVPRVTQFDEADITDVMELRKKFAPAYEQKGARLTLTSFVLKAVVGALQKFPIFNASLDEADRTIVLKQYYHLGLAVDTEQGLLVPVIRDVDKKSLLQVSKDITDVAEKARARKLSLEEMKGGTFTISNQGGIGGAHFTPIVNTPEVAILGLGQGAMKAVVREGKIVPRLMLPIAVSYDHRVIDGGTAARFAVELVQALGRFSEKDLAV